MTAQIDDRFRYKNTEYSVSGISEGEVFEPSLLNLKPVGMCSACWRGYQAIFALSDNRLVLDTLHVSLDGAEGESPPVINGVTPTGPEKNFDFFSSHYTSLNYHLEYSGGLLLADGFIRELYVHMGFHPAWKYERVIELVFEGGILRAEHDRSAQVADIRKQMASIAEQEPRKGMPSREEIAKFVERAFDRRYRF